MAGLDEVHRRSLEEPEAFWADAAAAIEWSEPWKRVLDDSRAPFYRWFPGGRLNTCHNALDRHVDAGHGDRLALILSAEAFVELPTWRDPEGVLALATLVVAPRDGYPDAAPDFLERRFPGVAGEVVFLDGPRLRLSASELRARAAAGRSLRYLVPDAVATYIGDHALYQDSRRTARS